jgi:hypothetical protein
MPTYVSEVTSGNVLGLLGLGQAPEDTHAGWCTDMCSDVGVSAMVGELRLLLLLAACMHHPGEAAPGRFKRRKGLGERDNGRPTGMGLRDAWLALPVRLGVAGGCAGDLCKQLSLFIAHRLHGPRS